MRREFIEGLVELAESDERVFLLTADLGFGAIEPFAEAFPDRFMNIGVAEQTMISVASGLAREGFRPYCYSIAAFAVARTWEFLRNGPVAHKLSVGLIGIGPGFDYGVDGHTHHALEDVGLMRLLPESGIICPSDAPSAKRYAKQGLKSGGLTYFRLARSGPDCHLPVLGEESAALSGGACAVVALGDLWQKAIDICDAASALGSRCDAYVVEELGSDESEAKLRALASYKSVVVVEGHLTRGGLASAVSEQLGRIGWGGRILPVGVFGLPTGQLGSAEYLWQQQTMDLDDIVRWCAVGS